MPKNIEQYEELEDRGDSYIEEDDLEEEYEEEEDLEEEEDDEETEEDSESEGEDDEDEEENEDDEEEARIPRSRLNQVIRQREEERERAAWLEEQLEKLIELQKANVRAAAPEEKPEVKFNYRAKLKEANEALLEGDLDKNAEILMEIEEARQKDFERAIQNAREAATKDAKSEATGSLEADKFDKVVESSLSRFEFLDTESASYNEEAVSLINATMAGYIAAGDTKSKALEKAVNKIAPLFDNKTKQSLGNKRTKDARKKAARASQQQPPETRRAAKGKAARELDTLDINKMSDDEFSKLSPREKKALRGD